MEEGKEEGKLKDEWKRCKERREKGKMVAYFTEKLSTMLQNLDSVSQDGSVMYASPQRRLLPPLPTP